MITGAVSYPLIILLTAMLVLVFMILVIVPMFEQVYARMGGELPAITRWIISLSGRFPVYLMTFLCVVVTGGLFFFFQGKNDRVRSVLASFLLRLPGLGTLVRKTRQPVFVSCCTCFMVPVCPC